MISIAEFHTKSTTLARCLVNTYQFYLMKLLVAALALLFIPAELNTHIKILIQAI